LVVMIIYMILLGSGGLFRSNFELLSKLGVILGSFEAICVIAQMGLLLSVGILGAVERKHAKRYLRASIG
jgi:hypothetical protein